MDNRNKQVSYDDTRDASIRIIESLSKKGIIKFKGGDYFEIQDTIQEEMNKILGVDIDDTFEVVISQTPNQK